MEFLIAPYSFLNLKICFRLSSLIISLYLSKHEKNKGCDKCDEWYHGDCIGINEKYAQVIKKWYCLECVHKYGLKVEYFPHFVKKLSHKKKKNKHHRQDKYPYMRSGLSCGRCSNCLKNEECGNKGYTMLHRRPHNYLNDVQNETRTATSYATEDWSRKFYKERRREMEERRSLMEVGTSTCNGPGCSNLCRVSSKYCSDECGLALAKVRILMILPHHLAQQLECPSVANRMDNLKLEEIKVKRQFIHEELQRLDLKERKLMELLERVKRLPITEFEEEPNLQNEDNKSSCVSCGSEVSSRTIIRHMESCFKKLEAQMTVESFTRSNSSYCHIFCDYYNAAKKTYCMRLRYVCPDHFKPRKAAVNEVCGCPVVKPVSLNIFSEPEKICQRPKKFCSQHYNWEINAISDIDLERHQEFNKLNELLKQETIIKKRMSNRLSAVGMLLHSTKMHLSTT